MPTAFLSKLSLLFSPHAPERAHPEITKGQAEANCDYDAQKLSVTCLVLDELAIQRDPADSRQNKENKARNFQPELVQNTPERTQRNLAGLEDRTHRPAAAGMLSRHLCENAQFAG
jgi:hypothetical protein